MSTDASDKTSSQTSAQAGGASAESKPAKPVKVSAVEKIKQDCTESLEISDCENRQSDKGGDSGNYKPDRVSGHGNI